MSEEATAPPRGRGETVPKAAPVGWVFIARLREDGFTIRWRRGEPVAYVLVGHRLGDHATSAGVLTTIPVALAGWTDLAGIRALGQRWMRQR